MSLGAQLSLATAVLATVTALAELGGAVNLGTALGIGQIAFAVTVVALLLKR